MGPMSGLVSLTGPAIHEYWVLGTAIGSWSLGFLPLRIPGVIFVVGGCNVRGFRLKSPLIGPY